MGSEKKILVAHANSISSSVADELEEVYGRSVIWNQSGDQILKLSREHSPSLLILDYELPWSCELEAAGYQSRSTHRDNSGEIIKIMRKLGNNAPIIVYALIDEDRHYFLERGATAYYDGGTGGDLTRKFLPLVGACLEGSTV